MNIGETIRNYRLQKGMSQGDIEKRTGLLRCYLSRVENGHTIPSLDTLSKIATAMELPLGQFFTEHITNGSSKNLPPLTEEEVRFLTQIVPFPGPEPDTHAENESAVRQMVERDRFARELHGTPSRDWGHHRSDTQPFSAERNCRQRNPRIDGGHRHELDVVPYKEAVPTDNLRFTCHFPSGRRSATGCWRCLYNRAP